jgi:putative tryptophan/tyrosine transport system substrate-binding protein
VKRREFITLLGGAAAAWPLAARGQQRAPAVVGLLGSVPFETRPEQVAAFHRGLQEAGYVEGHNVGIEYRSADNQVSRLPALARDLVSRSVTVIVTIGGDITARAAKGATATIPVVFVIGGDPVQLGLIATLNRPGGNVTGISFLVVLTIAKRLDLLTKMAPMANPIGVLVNPNNPSAESNPRDAQIAAETLGRKLVVVKAGTEDEIDTAFATLVREKVGAVLVDADPFFLARREQVLSWTETHAMPAIYSFREFAVGGGLMSYGTSLASAYHQAGVYAGRILNGEKPADVPVVQPTKFEFVINLTAAKMLRLDIPPSLLALADEVIE